MGGYVYDLTEEELEGGPPPASPEPVAQDKYSAGGYETSAAAPAPAAEPAPAPAAEPAASEAPPPAAPAEAAPAAAPAAATPQYAQENPYSETMPSEGSGSSAPAAETETPPPAKPSGGEVMALNQQTQYNKGNVYTAPQGSQARGADAAGSGGIKPNPYTAKVQPQADRSGATMAKPSGMGYEEPKTSDDYRAIEGAGSTRDRAGFNAGGGTPGVSSFADIEVGSRFPTSPELTKSQELSGNAPPPTSPLNVEGRRREAFMGAGTTSMMGTGQQPQPFQDPNNTTFAGDRSVQRTVGQPETYGLEGRRATVQWDPDYTNMRPEEAHETYKRERAINDAIKRGQPGITERMYPGDVDPINRSIGESIIVGAANAKDTLGQVDDGGNTLVEFWQNPMDSDFGGLVDRTGREEAIIRKAVARGADSRVGNANNYSALDNFGWTLGSNAGKFFDFLTPPEDPHSAPDHVLRGIANGIGWINDGVGSLTGGAVSGGSDIISTAGDFKDHPERYIDGVNPETQPEWYREGRAGFAGRGWSRPIDGDPGLGRMAGAEETFNTNSSLGRRAGGAEPTPGDPSLGRMAGAEETFNTNSSLGRRAGVDRQGGDPSLGRQAGAEEVFTDASFGRVGGAPEPGSPGYGRRFGGEEVFTDASFGRRGGGPDAGNPNVRTPENTAIFTDRRPVEGEIPPPPKADGFSVDGVYYPYGPESLPIPAPPYRGKVIGPLSPSLASDAKDDWYLNQAEELPYLNRTELGEMRGLAQRQIDENQPSLGDRVGGFLRDKLDGLGSNVDHKRDGLVENVENTAEWLRDPEGFTAAQKGASDRIERKLDDVRDPDNRKQWGDEFNKTLEEGVYDGVRWAAGKPPQPDVEDYEAIPGRPGITSGDEGAVGYMSRPQDYEARPGRPGFTPGEPGRAGNRIDAEGRAERTRAIEGGGANPTRPGFNAGGGVPGVSSFDLTSDSFRNNSTRQNQSPAEGDVPPKGGNPAKPGSNNSAIPATGAKPSDQITGRKDDWQDVKWAKNVDQNGNVSWVAVSNLNTTPLKDANGNDIPGGGKPELVRDENGKPIIARGSDGKVYNGANPPDGADPNAVPGTGKRGSANQPERQASTDGKVKPQGDPVAAADVPAATTPAPVASTGTGGGGSSGGGSSSSDGGGYTKKSSGGGSGSGWSKSSGGSSGGGGGWSRSSGGSSGGGGGWSKSSGSGKSSGRWPFGGSDGDHIMDAKGGKWTFDRKSGMWKSSDGRMSRKRPKGKLVRGKRSGMFGNQRPESGVFNSSIFNRYKDVSGDDLTWGPVSDGMVGGVPVAGVPSSVEFGTPPPTHPARAGKAGKRKG